MLFDNSSSNPVEPMPGPQQFLMVGLGNPGREYRENRHNIGFMMIDALGKSIGIGMTRVQSKALVGQGLFAGQRVVLAKPQTFMNLSGQAALVRFYKVPLANMMVIVDDMDLPFGTIRLRPAGGSAGQKGLKSIIEQLGSNEFPRLRIGIGRPPGRMEAANYVLENFSGSDKDLLAQVLDRSSRAGSTFIEYGLDQAMNQFNGDLLKG
jgi:PTH1 family peptidyl-tRNA hydrolase